MFSGQSTPATSKIRKSPTKMPCTNHEQHDRSALEDPDTGPAFSRIVVSMHLRAP